MMESRPGCEGSESSRLAKRGRLLLTKARALLFLGLFAVATSLGVLSCGGGPGPQLVVIGLDGATWEVLDPWLEAGKLPNLKALRDASSYGTLNSILPTLSPPAWTTAVTGVNPGRHAIYDFQKKLSGETSIVSETANSRRSEPIWNYLKGKGLRTCVVNVPMTDPPDEVDGVMVAGFPHVDDFNFVYPRERQKDVEAMGYLRDRMEMKLPTGEEQTVLDSLLLVQERRFELAEKLFAEERWDLFWVVFTQTDRVQHLYWKFSDPEHPDYNEADARRYGDAIEQVWTRCDALLGRFLQIIPEDAWILVLSDHGFGPIHREVRLGNLLRDPDYGFTEEEAFDVFSLDRSDASRIYIRQKLMDSQAKRSPESAKRLQAKIKDVLERLQDPETGEDPIQAVYERSSIFAGSELEKAPNLTVQTKRGWFVSLGDVEDDFQMPVFGDPQSSLSGWHLLNGVFMLRGPGAAVGSRPASEIYSLLDIVPTCLYVMDQTVPEDLDGDVMTGAVTPAFLSQQEVKMGGFIASEDRRLTKEEEEQIRNVPYIGQ